MLSRVKLIIGQRLVAMALERWSSFSPDLTNARVLDQTYLDLE